MRPQPKLRMVPITGIDPDRKCEAPDPPPTRKPMQIANPSDYQEEIFGFVTDPNPSQPNGIVNAVAGAGKTTTLEHAAGLIDGRGLFCAFNKHIADNLKGRLAGSRMDASTIHSIGMKTLYRGLGVRPVVSEGKYWRVVREHVDQYPGDVRGISRSVPRLVKLCNFIRMTLTNVNDVEALSAMSIRYNLEFEEAMAPVLLRLMARGQILAEKEGDIDFTDMLSLPHYLNLQPDQYPWLFVDECQDLNRAQLELALKCCAPGGRSLWVGDPSQAIMAFAGSDSRSYDAIKERVNARELPLSICYRCPTEVLKIAREIVPHILARPGAPAGMIRRVDESALITAKIGDLIMCRRNAPLVKHCLRLVRQKVHARMRGRDIGKELADVVREIGTMCGHYDDFPIKLGYYEARERSILESKNAPDTQVEALADRCEALLECYEGFAECRAVAELATKIEGIFTDIGAAVWFSSIHRAKGLEAERTWILQFEKLGEPRSRSSLEEAQQEKNLRYVAITRSLHTMHML